MSGVIAGAVIAAAVIGAGVGVYGAEKNAQGQKAALRQQRLAQDQAQRDMVAQRRRADVALAAANKRTPDTTGIMAQSALGASGGVGATMLTGPGGISPGGLTLGKPGLLGG